MLQYILRDLRGGLLQHDRRGIMRFFVDLMSGGDLRGPPWLLLWLRGGQVQPKRGRHSGWRVPVLRGGLVQHKWRVILRLYGLLVPGRDLRLFAHFLLY